jgi:hypothetical protein
MAKERTSVPPEVSAEVLFLQDHTCCVCREPGKAVQLHHIDDDPTNHSIPNLAVLCFDDHDRTQVRGGFGKKLLSAEVEKYRDDWIVRVGKRRAKADDMAAASMGRTAKSDQDVEWSPPPNAQLIAYVDHLPILRKVAYDNARKGWDTGVTAEMRGATSEVIDILEHVLNYLSVWYSPNHFGPEGTKKYFNDYVASRYLGHRSLHDPQGPGSGGTIVGVIAAGGVMTDLSKAVEEIVEALGVGEIDLIKWRRRWNAAEKGPSPSFRARLSNLVRRFYWVGV